LIVFGLAIVLPVLVFAALLFGQVQGQERRRTEVMASTLAVNVGRDVEREISRDTLMLKSLGTNAFLREGNIEAFRSRARELGSVIGGRFVLDLAPGREHPAQPGPARGFVPGVDVVVSDLRPAAAGEGDVFALVLPLLQDGAPAGTLSLELPTARLTELLVEEEVPPGWVTEVHDGTGRRIAASPGASAQDAGPDGPPNAAGRSEEEQVLWASQDGQGRRSLAVSHPIATSRWTVTAVVPGKALQAPMHRSVILLAWLGGGLVLLSFLLALFFGRRLAEPIRQVTAAAVSLSDGKLPNVPSSSVREANELVRALATTADVLRQRSEDLTRAHDELANVYEGSPIGIGLFDPDGKVIRINRAMSELALPLRADGGLDVAGWSALAALIREVDEGRAPVSGRDVVLRGASRRVFRASAFPAGCPLASERAIGVTIEDVTERRAAEVAVAESNQRIQRLLDANFFGIALVTDGDINEANDAFLSIIGYSRQDLAGGLRLQTITPAEFHGADARALEEVEETGLCRAFEKDLLRSDGRRIPALVGYARLNREPLSVICFALDLTEQRQRDTQRRYLMRELTHRTKNLLAVVQAMAVQTAKTSGTPSEFHDRFAARLQGLAGSHDLLVQENWSGASMRDLVRSQLGHYAEGIGTQIHLDGPSLLLEPEAAQNLGMALHELSTNAAKYGALSVPEGRVDITWRMQPAKAEAEPQFVVDWRESGGPRVVAPRRRGFGHVVMDRLAARALNGQVQMTFAPEGVWWRLTAPARIATAFETPADES
jgi:PAS domain S-box-containing protein